MKRITLLTAALAAAVVIATATPAFARRDPGAGGMAMYNYGPTPPTPGGMPIYNYGPQAATPPRIGQNGLNGQYADGMNLYQYVRSNPTNRVDPQGLWGYPTHYRATYDTAIKVGFNKDCAKILADWNQGVDNWTPAWNPFATQFHFNKDVDGNPFPCGRDCWFQKRWDKGVDKLKRANVYWSPWIWDVSVTDGLAHIGEALHSRQDSFAHNIKHHAETPFDHAPDKLCFLWGDWFGSIHQRCINARLTNPNWGNNGRPDDENLPEWQDDLRATIKDTETLLKDIWKIPAVQCHCKNR